MEREDKTPEESTSPEEFKIDQAALICAVDWLSEGYPMDAVVAHLKSLNWAHKVKLPDDEVAAEVKRAWDTWPIVRDHYVKKT